MGPEIEAAYEALFSGNGRRMLPVGDALLAALDGLDGPVEVGVARLYVWFATPRRQFGLFFPASGRRVTLRLRFDGSVGTQGRVQSIADRAPKDRFDVRVYLAGVGDVDGELCDLLERARRHNA